jgi:glycosyltransferase involved in cell wall biosynthesis
MRILWVVPRYGHGIAGGAETLVRALAARSAAMGWTAEVATTCARDHVTWADELPAGTTVEDGVTVHRFPVGPRDGARYDALHAAVVGGRAGYADELEWLANSVWSPAMEAYLEDEDGHDLRVLAPYLFGTTLWGAQTAPARSALLPCLHDEPYARLETVRRVLGAVRGCLFNAPAEERLARRLAPVRGGGVVGMGFDPPPGPPGPAPAALDGLGPYLVYAGRLEEGKRVQVAVEGVLRLAAERADAPSLVLMGRGGYRAPAEASGRVVELGYVTEEEKRAVYANAVALVNPSEMESLSIVLMEAWLEGTPAIVAAGSEVMADHVARSGGGMTFASYDELRAAAARLLDDPAEAERMGAAGRAYVLDEYGWPAVQERLAAVAGRLAGG